MISIIKDYFLEKSLALQSFFFARPRIDIDLINNPGSLAEKKALGYSKHQRHPNPVPVKLAVYDFLFTWNYKLRIKNNSSKTAYNIKIEKVFKNDSDYLQKTDDLITLKEGDLIELDYFLRHNSSLTGEESIKFLKQFPAHVERIEILVSYANEARKKFYTKFVATPDSKVNKHLLKKPKL